MPYCTTRNARLYYEIHGQQGPWITLINGHTRTSKDFRILAKNLSMQGYRCLCPDNRGSGATESQGTFSILDMSADVREIWKDLGISQSHLVGISMGGMICQQLALESQTLLKSLTLVSTAPSESYLANLKDGPWSQIKGENLARLERYVSANFFVKNRLLIESMAKNIADLVINQDFNTRSSLQRQAIQGFHTQERLATINVPTQILHGSLDMIIPPSAASQLHEGIPPSVLKIIPEVGHLLLAEWSRGLTEAILHFVDEVELSLREA